MAQPPLKETTWDFVRDTRGFVILTTAPCVRRFNPWFKSILEETKTIFKTKEGTTFIFPGTGTGGWESALTNTLSPGDKIVTFRYGQFSHLWVSS